MVSVAVRGLWLATVLMLTRPCVAAPSPISAQASGGWTEARAAFLTRHVELARAGRRFLELDARDGTLTLYHGAAPLRVWPVLSVSAGTHRFRLGREGSDCAWQSRVWETPTVDPPPARARRTIVSDSVGTPDLAGADAWIPPTPEDAVPTPARFVARFAGGMGLEIVAVPTPAARGGWTQRVRALGRHVPALVRGNRDHYRIRIELPGDEAGSLYRAFPTDAAFLAFLPSGPPVG